MIFYKTSLLIALFFFVSNPGFCKPKHRFNSYLKIGAVWTKFNPVLLKGQPAPLPTAAFTKKSFAFQLSYIHQIKGDHFIELTLQPKKIEFYTRYSYTTSRGVEYQYSDSYVPALDFLVTYDHKYHYRKFIIQPKIGLVFFIQLNNADTTDFLPPIVTESANGYYGSSLKVGYIGGADFDYTLGRRLFVGINASYQSPFRNNINYFYRERLQYSHEPDITYGLRQNNFYLGLHFTLNIGKQ